MSNLQLTSGQINEDTEIPVGITYEEHLASRANDPKFIARVGVYVDAHGGSLKDLADNVFRGDPCDIVTFTQEIIK